MINYTDLEGNCRILIDALFRHAHESN